MDQEVAQTLAALQRRLADLERELTSLAAENDSHSPGGALADHSPIGTPVSHSPGGTPVSHSPEGTPVSHSPGGVLVDEAVEQRFSMEARETVFGEIPATRDERQSIDLADLVRFREKMQATLQSLIDEYSRLLSLKPPTDA